jgi:DNA-binding MarR family transcriptional regulator
VITHIIRVMTRMLDRLESAELIGRERDPSDRRFVTTRIKDRGLDLLEALDDPVQALYREHFHGLDEGALRALIGLLGRIRESIWCRASPCAK